MSLLFLNMQSTANVYCRQIIDIFIAHGVKTAFCCPGSRNAPLLIALDARQDIKKCVVVDERSAAFQAIGCALVEQRPVMLVCTSGSAVLNFSPAVAEAYYAGVPLIVVSADRPREWIDQDDSQTIRQFHILDHIVKGSYDVRAIPEGGGMEFSREVQWTVNRTVNEAMLKAMTGKQGPVHINVQLSDPLGNIENCEYTPERHVSSINTVESLSPRIVNELAVQAFNAKIMLVVGFSAPDHYLDRAVRKFASLPNVVVMAETLANLHEPQPYSTMIDSVLCEMTNDDKQKMRPDIVIYFGGALVSRMLKQYLRKYPPLSQWSIGHYNYFGDCFQSLTEIIDVAPASFLKQLYGAMRKLGHSQVLDYANLWITKKRAAVCIADKYIAESNWSDLKAINYILRNLPLDNLFVSNGTCVRYSQLIPHKCHAEYCNRGVSGIDGSTATAVGGANAYSGKTVLLTGDMSWLYDSGASTLYNVPSDMRFVVIDNSGGGIFRFIKSTSSIDRPTLEQYFCVQNLPAVAPIAESYGMETIEVADMDHLKDGVAWLSEESDLPRLLVVKTPPEDSSDILRSYFSKSILNN